MDGQQWPRGWCRCPCPAIAQCIPGHGAVCVRTIRTVRPSGSTREKLPEDQKPSSWFWLLLFCVLWSKKSCSCGLSLTSGLPWEKTHLLVFGHPWRGGQVSFPRHLTVNEEGESSCEGWLWKTGSVRAVAAKPRGSRYRWLSGISDTRCCLPHHKARAHARPDGADF